MIAILIIALIIFIILYIKKSKAAAQESAKAQEAIELTQQELNQYKKIDNFEKEQQRIQEQYEQKIGTHGQG